MSSLGATAQIPLLIRRDHGDGAVRAALWESVRRLRGLSPARERRLQLLLLVAAALVATVLPLALAAADALRPLGIAGGGSLQTLVLVVALGLAAPLASLKLSPLRILGVGAGLAGALTVLAEGGVDEQAMLSLSYPAIALALSVVGTVAVQHVLLEFEHEHQRLQCTRFVPEQVVEQVLSRTDLAVGLGGIEVAGTIAFVDLRGFTSFSEARPAEQVIRVLNHYLSEFACAMLDHGGTVVSYLGDGLMAVFGAPVEQADHADRALAAAREILEKRLPRANEWLRDEGLGDGFRIGIGVNSGSFVAGNVGNDRRLEYTAIGDAANTASRIEGVTKEAGRMLLVSRSTCEDVCDETREGLVYMGEFDIRGRHDRVELWSLDCAA